MRKSAFLTLALLILSCNIWAQTTAQISGTVKDSTGAVIPGAEVTVTQTDTGATRSAITGTDGSFSFPALPVGPYKLQASMQGFAAYVQSGIVLQVNSNPVINPTLKVGGISEQVEVNANAAMVETKDNSIGQLIDQQRVSELPLNGRNVTQLIALSGAAVASTGGGTVTNMNYPTVAAFSIAGGQGNSTNYFLDGGSHLDPRTNVGLPLPFPDALQEFKVETSMMPANYGAHPGGAVNAVTKSGTNSFHGNAFEYVRNYVLNSRNFFAKSRDSLKRNQYGGVLGGPVVRDKLFFFGAFQATKERTAPATTQAFVPTAAVLQGDFRTILGPGCVKNPVTLNTASGAVNNVLPAGNLNPVALKFLGLIPAASDPCGKILYGVPRISDEYTGVVRVDWQRTAKDSIFGRYFVTDYSLVAYYDKTNILTAGNPGLMDRVQSFILGDTYLINSRTVNAFRISYSRSAIQRVNANGIPTLQDLGSKISAPIKNYTGQVFAGSYFSLSSIPGYVFTNIYDLSEDLSLKVGAHQLAMGFSWNHTQLNSLGPFQMNPRFVFTGQMTGDALADLITGSATIFLQGNGQIGRDRKNLPALYIQDNWKVAPRFQINAGLRWDPFIPQYQKYGYAQIFDRDRFRAGQVSQVFVNAPPGLLFPGDPGFPGQSDTFPRYRIFAPRVGFVFDPSGNGTATIRGGYGIFYDSTYLWNTLHMPLNPPWGNTITLNGINMSDPWQNYSGGNPFPTPSKFPSNFLFPAAGTYTFEPAHAKPTYLQQWNLSLQRQFGNDWMASATYLGNKTTNQWLGRELNPAVYGPGATTGNTQARRLFNQINPQTGKYFASVTEVDDSGNASYNGMLLVLQHRMSKNFSLLANYTWSHCLNQGDVNQDITNFYQDPANRRAEWGNCGSDRRHLLNLSSVLQSPKYASKWVQWIAGNWQLSSIFTYGSGSPLNVLVGTDVSLTGVTVGATGTSGDRPNVVGNSKVANPTIAQWFNTAAFAKQQAGTYGNAARNPITGPGSWNMDMALWRTFRILENTQLNLRWEVFNLLNHARFGNPGTTLSNPNTFGVISSALDPRIMQLALKLSF